MARWDDKTVTRRANAAQQVRQSILPFIQACLAMAMPWRLGKQRGSAAFESLFDSTAPVALMRGANRFQRDVTPPFQRWFELEAGPLVPDDQVEAVNRALEGATKILHAALDASAFHTASLECYGDLFVGTAALLALEGDDNMPVRWISGTAWDLAFEEGPGGRIDNVFWEKEFQAYLLTDMWPEAVWSKKTAKLIAKGDEAKVKVRQSSYYDPDIQRWRICVQECGEDSCVWESSRDRTNPWIIFRYWTTPGDPWGRGPLMLQLPNIRTANKTVEMILTAAAYQLAPPLMVSHDGVVNPDTMNLAPRALIRVARTGGPMGPSIATLPIGGNVDVGQIVLEDQRQTIKRSLLDDQLPPPTGAVRSASEIIERQKNLQYDAGAAFGRMNHEFVPQVVSRLIDLLDRRKVAVIQWAVLKIDQLTMKVKLTGPMARTQNLEDVQTIVQFWELVKGLSGDEVFHLIANQEDGWPKLAKLMGVPLWAVNDEKARATISHAIAAMAAHAMNDNGGGAPGAAPPGPTGAAATQPTPAPGVADFAA